jgi:hypothetical protein
MWLAVVLIVYFYSEFFTIILINSSFKNLKFFSSQLTKLKNPLLIKNLSFVIILNFFIMFLLTLKINISNILLTFIIVYIMINKYTGRYFNNYITFLNFNIIIFLFLFFFINNYVLFYLFIELYAIIFYFFFLNINFNFKQLSLLNYKNSLLLYLFNNFLTSVLYLIGLSYIVSNWGTINFYELNFFSYLSLDWSLYLLIFSFIFKLSLPGYHFLKIEIYKYLSLNNVILFSVITLYLNFLFTIFFFNHNLILSVLTSFKILNLLVLCIFFFFLHKLKISNFQEFVSYSGFATNNLIILNFLV